MKIRPWRSAKCAGDELPALRAEQERPEPCRARSRRPRARPARCRRPATRRRAARRPTNVLGTSRPAPTGAASGSSRLASAEQGEVGDADPAVGDGEGEAGVAERVRARTAPRRAGRPSRRTSPGARRPPRGRRRSSARRSPTHAHHRTASTSRPLPSPAQVGLAGHQRRALRDARGRTRGRRTARAG